jgi:hypothetical protein
MTLHDAATAMKGTTDQAIRRPSMVRNDYGDINPTMIIARRDSFQLLTQNSEGVFPLQGYALTPEDVLADDWEIVTLPPEWEES